MINKLKIGAIASATLAHTTCVCAGVYKGNMNADGVDVDIPFRYFWGSNTVLTGLEKRSFNEDEGNIKSLLRGGTIGAIAAPIEFTIGWGMGYAGRFIIDSIIPKVFY